MQAGTRFTYSGGMEGWVDLSDWLYTEMVYQSADTVTHPNSNHLIAIRLGVELTTFRSWVERPNYRHASKPPIHATNPLGKNVGLYTRCKSHSLSSRPIGGADLRFLVPQPDTSLHCEITDTKLVFSDCFWILLQWIGRLSAKCQYDAVMYCILL